MILYPQLAAHLAAGEVIRLDGAVGTQLQTLGVPINRPAWAAAALDTHPGKVLELHRRAIETGAEVITTNSYASARHNLAREGLDARRAELNQRAVTLAQEARDTARSSGPVYIAGSISAFGITACAAEETRRHYADNFGQGEQSETEARDSLNEQADLLAKAGCDLLIAEPIAGTRLRKWVVEAAVATGLPVWVGFSCLLDSSSGAVTIQLGDSEQESLKESIAEVMVPGCQLATIFHSSLDASLAALAILRDAWDGPIGVYPEGERHDYLAAEKHTEEDNAVTPETFAAFAQDCVAAGAQVIGGCCGVEIDHMKAMKAVLPARLSN